MKARKIMLGLLGILLVMSACKTSHTLPGAGNNEEGSTKGPPTYYNPATYNVCSGKTTAMNTYWQQDEADIVYVDVVTSKCQFASYSRPIYIASVLWPNQTQALGATSIYKPTYKGFRIYLVSAGITAQQARESGLTVSWQSSATPAKISGTFCAGYSLYDKWVSYGTDGLYIDVDTSTCGFTDAPYITISLTGQSEDIRYAQGTSAVYSLTKNGFRVYLKYTNQTDVAKLGQWKINWFAAAPKTTPDFCSGSYNNFIQENSTTLLVNIPLNQCGFTAVPIITTSLVGTNHWTVKGVSYLLPPEKTDSFSMRINVPSGITVSQANSLGWKVNWLAIKKRVSDHPGIATPPVVNFKNITDGQSFVKGAVVTVEPDIISQDALKYTQLTIEGVYFFSRLINFFDPYTIDTNAVYTDSNSNPVGLAPGTYKFTLLARNNQGDEVTREISVTILATPIPTPANVKTGPKVATPYWVLYAKSIMDRKTVINHCVQYSYSNECTLYRSEIHWRRDIVDQNYEKWYPFYGPYSGNIPGYYKLCNPATGASCSFSDIGMIYYTAWYLQTDELSINDSTFGLTVTKTIWPGEVTSDGWGVVPLSNDILNTKWIALVPQGKTYGQNGIMFKNFAVSIDTTGMIKGGGPGPQTGTEIGARSTYRYNSATGKHEIYITGVNTGCQAYNGALECLSKTICDYNQTIDNMNGEGVWTSNVNAVIQKIKEIKESNPSAKIDLYGHSLGAAEATLIYNLKNTNGTNFLGSTDRVMVISPPLEIPNEYMLPNRNPATYIAYGGINDIINGKSSKNASRRAAGINIMDVNTGTGVLDPHDRSTYQSVVWGNSWW